MSTLELVTGYEKVEDLIDNLVVTYDRAIKETFNCTEEQHNNYGRLVMLDEDLFGVGEDFFYTATETMQQVYNNLVDEIRNKLSEARKGNMHVLDDITEIERVYKIVSDLI